MARLLRACFDLKVYAEIHRQPLRLTLLHLVRLVCLATAALSVVVTLGVGRLVERLLREADKLPTITIKDGEASANVPQPWVKVLAEEHGRKLVAIIDTTGAREGFAADEQGLFLARRHLYLKGEDGGVRAIALSRIGDRTIGPELIKRWLVRARWLVPLAVTVALFVWFWLAKGVQALVLTLVALIASSGRRRPLGFTSLFTVATHALSAPVLAAVLVAALPVRVPYFFVLYFAAAVVYTVLAVRRIPDEPQLTLV